MKLSIYTCLLSCTLFFGCSDKKEDLDPICRIVTINSDPAGSSYQISYDGQGRVATVIAGNKSTVYSYSGTTVTEVVTTSGVFNWKNILTYSDQGVFLNFRSESNEAGTEWSNISYQYTGGQLSQSINTYSSGAPTTTMEFTWSNGNVVKVVEGSFELILDYYTDKTWAPGDAFWFNDVVNGLFEIRSKNLVKSLTSNGVVTSYTYTYGTDGRIESMTRSVTSNGSVTKLNYSYQCN